MPLPPLARDLQLWPELVEIGSEVHTGRRKSLYAALFQGQHVMFKVSAGCVVCTGSKDGWLTVAASGDPPLGPMGWLSRRIFRLESLAEPSFPDYPFLHSALLTLRR